MKSKLTITSHPVVVALGATLLFIESGLNLHAPMLFSDVCMVFSLTLAAYGFPYDNRSFGNVGITARILFFLAVVSAVMAMVLRGTPQHFIAICCCFILFFFYRFGSLFGFSLRGNAFVKGPVIALCWTIITVFLPVNLYSTTIDNLVLLQMALLNFCFVLAMAWLCDLADLKSDAEKGLQTISVQLGPRLTILLALMMMMVCTIAITFLKPQSANSLEGMALADVLAGLAVIAVVKLPGIMAKWMVDALLLCKPLVMICITA